MVSSRDTLIDARELIKTPEKLKKGGQPWGRSDGFTIIDAIFAVNASIPDKVAALALLEKVLPSQDIRSFNDHPDTTHADVMALFDRAIAACSGEQVAGAA